jgi:hypothetical protein
MDGESLRFEMIFGARLCSIFILASGAGWLIAPPLHAKTNDGRTAFEIADRALTPVMLGASRPPQGAIPTNEKPSTCEESNFVFCRYNRRSDETGYAFMKIFIYL